MRVASAMRQVQKREAEKARLKKIAKATERAAQPALSQDEKKTKTKKRKQEAPKTRRHQKRKIEKELGF